MTENGETAPLLSENVPNLARGDDRGGIDAAMARIRRATNVRAIVYCILSAVFVVALVSMLFFWEDVSGTIGGLPRDPHEAALAVMKGAPVIVSSARRVCENLTCGTETAFGGRTYRYLRLLVPPYMSYRTESNPRVKTCRYWLASCSRTTSLPLTSASPSSVMLTFPG